MLPHLWITNLSSSRDVAIHDLNLVVRKRTSINLYDFRRYPHLTFEQINNSAQFGDLLLKTNLKIISIRVVPPSNRNKPLYDLELAENILPRKARSAITSEEKHFDELEISDTDFADQATSEK